MAHGQISRKQAYFYALFSFALGLLVLYIGLTAEGLPPREQLERARGRVEWVEDGRYGVKFQLVGNARTFDYSGKGNASDRVYDALSVDGTQVEVLYDAIDPFGPAWSSREYFPVYEVWAAGEIVRSRDEVDAAWRADNRFAPWLGAMLLGSGIFFLIYASTRAR